MKKSERLHKKHVELYDWCAKTGKDKLAWPGWKKKANAAYLFCFACVEAERRGGEQDQDCRCPITWTDDDRKDQPCGQEDSPYNKFKRSENAQDRKKYAAIIRDLPWSPRPEVKACICTEEEARKKWCPMVRGIDYSEQCYVTPWLPCAASNCMMWRWATEDGATVYLPTSEKWTCEYCDGQGKHEKFIEDDPEQPECRNPEGICLECDGMGSGTKVARAGFCGLGGKP